MTYLRNHRAWLIGLGILTISLGLLAGVAALQGSVRFEVYLGVIFILVGLSHAVHSFWSRPWGGFCFQIIGAIQYFLVGMMLLAQRGPGAVVLVLLLSMLFIMQGMVQFSLVSQLHPHINRGWMLVSAILAVFLGACIWSQWPSSAYWVVGLFVGVHLILRGVPMVALGFAIRRLEYDGLRRLTSTAARSGETVHTLVCRKRMEVPEEAGISV